MSRAVWSQLGPDHIPKQHCEDPEHKNCGQLESVFAIVFVFVYLCISCSHIRVVIGLRELLSTPRSAANWSPNRTGSDRAGRSLAVPVQNIGIASYHILYYNISYSIIFISFNILYIQYGSSGLATQGTKLFTKIYYCQAFSKTKYSVWNVHHFWSSIWSDLFVNKQ